MQQAVVACVAHPHPIFLIGRQTVDDPEAVHPRRKVTPRAHVLPVRGELDDTVTFRIAGQHVPLAGDRQEGFVVQRLPVPGRDVPLFLRGEGVLGFFDERLDALVPGVRDVHDALGVDGQPDRFVELSGFETEAAKLGDVFALFVEDHDAFIARIGHEHAALAVHGQGARPPEGFVRLRLPETSP